MVCSLQKYFIILIFYREKDILFMKKKILFICNVDWFFLSHRLPIGLAAISKGYEVHLATTFSSKEKYFTDKGFFTHNIKINRSKTNIINLIKTFSEILKLIVSIKPDLIHAITIKPVILGGIASRICKNIPFVASISGLGYVFISKGIIAELIKLSVRIIYKIAICSKRKKIIFQNLDDEKMIKKICNLKNKDISLIPGSGIDLKKYNPVNNDINPKVILFASRLLKSKGVLEFVESASAFRNSEYKFVMAGKFDNENPDCITREYLNSFISQGFVEYVGDYSDIRGLLSQSKIIVLPSYYGEGLPKILIEAAACGIPVITTNHPGCRDAIIPGETGFLIPVKDSKALINALSTLLEDNKLCQNMGKKGRELALRRYDIKQVVNTHMAIYEQLLKKK